VPSLPLDGIRIVSLAEQYPGPFATMLLSDLGADVVAIERPDGGDPTRAFGPFYASMARGKRSVALDLKTDRGRDAARTLLDRSDALIEGFRPGTLQRLGLGYDTLRESNPGLVYVSVSGFGQTGPYRDRTGHDLTYQAEAGMLYEHVPPAAVPAPPSLALGDLAAALMAAQAVLVGIVARHRSGLGTYVDVSMMDCLVSLLTTHLGPVVNRAEGPGFPYEPGYGVFATSDHEHIAIGVAHEDRFWRALCDVTGLVSYRDLSASGRRRACAPIDQALRGVIKARTADEWEDALTGADVPYGRLRTLADVAESPQVKARELLATVPGLDEVYVRQPLRFAGGEAPGPRRGVPGLGEHTAEVLTEAGVDPDDIAALTSLATRAAATATAAKPTAATPTAAAPPR
jgi:crotonobetainyl-CoA:carnitine CoA-transferase CaiB-like acyl-CoA transferase